MLFDLFKNKEKNTDLVLHHTQEALIYLNSNYSDNNSEDIKSDELDVQYCSREYCNPDIKYSSRASSKEKYSLDDDYDETEIGSAMKDYLAGHNPKHLNNVLENSLRKTFSRELSWYIENKGLRNSDVYNAANIDRRLFSKILLDPAYKPSKNTALALCLALKLNFDEAADLLSRAGYALSHSNKRDVIVEYFLKEKFYKLDIINEVLYSLGEKIIA